MSMQADWLARMALRSRFYLWTGIARMIVPEQGSFGLRARALRLAGVDVHSSVRISRTVRFVYPNISVGSATFIGPEVLIYSNARGQIVVGRNVDIAPRVVICAGSHEVGLEGRRAGEGIGSNISIGDGTWIGLGATILLGSSIGNMSIVAAGAVVNGDFPPNSLLAGVPAKVVRVLGTKLRSTTP